MPLSFLTPADWEKRPIQQVDRGLLLTLVRPAPSGKKRNGHCPALLRDSPQVFFILTCSGRRWGPIVFWVSSYVDGAAEYYLFYFARRLGFCYANRYHKLSFVNLRVATGTGVYTACIQAKVANVTAREVRMIDQKGDNTSILGAGFK